MRFAHRLLSTTVLISTTLALGTTAAVAHDDGHGHDHGEAYGDYADAVIWDGQSTVDCRVTGEGTIRWELTGSDRVTHAELHIDEPVRSVTSRNAPPYVWVSDLYPLDQIEADADRITGDLADDAQLLATTCPEGGVDESTVAPLALSGAGGLVVGLLGAGRLARRRGNASDGA